MKARLRLGLILGIVAVIVGSVMVYAVGGWVKTDEMVLDDFSHGHGSGFDDAVRDFFALSADGNTVAVATAHWTNFDAEVHIYTDTDGDGSFSDDTASKQVVRVLEGNEGCTHHDTGGYTCENGEEGGVIYDIKLNEDGTRLVVYGSLHFVGNKSLSFHRMIRTYDLTSTPTNTAPTVDATVYTNSSGSNITTADTGSTVITSILFSEAIGTPVIKHQTGSTGMARSFDIITSGDLDNGKCKATTVNHGYACQHTLTDTGLFKVFVSEYADTAGLAGTPQTYSTNSGGVSVVRATTNYTKTADFTGTKGKAQALTLPESIDDTTGLELVNAPFGGKLLKTVSSGDRFEIRGHFVMNKGNTQQVYYKDGSAPKSVTDGTLLGGGTPQWAGNTASQHWTPQTSVPANRYYWIRSSMDITYSSGSWIQVKYQY